MKFTFALVFVIGCAPSGPRDVTEHAKDVTKTPAAQYEGYEHVVKVKHGVIALAESRGIPKESAKEAVDKLAASFEGCLANFEAKGPVKQGAARIVVPVDDGGLVSEPLVKASDDSYETKLTVLVCLVGPVKLMAFPPPGRAADAKTRGMAIEATWP